MEQLPITRKASHMQRWLPFWEELRRQAFMTISTGVFWETMGKEFEMKMHKGEKRTNSVSCLANAMAEISAFATGNEVERRDICRALCTLKTTRYFVQGHGKSVLG